MFEEDRAMKKDGSNPKPCFVTLDAARERAHRDGRPMVVMLGIDRSAL